MTDSTTKRKRRVSITTESNIDISTFEPSGFYLDNIMEIRGIREQEKIFANTYFDRLFDIFDSFTWSPRRKTIGYKKQITSKYIADDSPLSEYKDIVARHNFELEGKEEHRRRIADDIPFFENDNAKIVLATELIIDKENLQHLKKMVEGSLKVHEEGRKKYRYKLWSIAGPLMKKEFEEYVRGYLEENFKEK